MVIQILVECVFVHKKYLKKIVTKKKKTRIFQTAFLLLSLKTFLNIDTSLYHDQRRQTFRHINWPKYTMFLFYYQRTHHKYTLYRFNFELSEYVL